METETRLSLCRMDDILNTPGSVLIDDWDAERRRPKTYLLTDPIDVISAISIGEVQDALNAIDDLQAQGRYLAGYFAYDAGLALDKPMLSRHKPNVPLLWFGVYDSVKEINCESLDLPEPDSVDRVGDIRLDVSDDEYLECIRRIKEYIQAGDVYQVNYTCRMLFENSGTAAGLFARLRKAHPVRHSAFINAGDFQVISVSPELFLRRTGNKLLARPMKGTARRGRFFEEDSSIADHLWLDEKNRAENLMIVDLMRNDIGRLCRFGGVSAPRLFRIERYRSVFQMTSDVEGVLRDDVSSGEIMRATLPPGSVTGAPKIRAKEIIDDLESSSRGVYCGSIGMFAPGGDFLLNVAIRTIVQKGSSCELGLGSGIVADSDPADELRETLLKGAFLRSEPGEHRLLETLLYTKGEGYMFLDEHLKRMSQSAIYFGWRFAEDAIGSSLKDTAVTIDLSKSVTRARVRLLYSQDGAIETQWSPMDVSADGPVKLMLAARRCDPDSIFLYHKTTERQDYDSDFRDAQEAGYANTLYLNNGGELTECATANIILEIDGAWVTPPISSGLLPGIWRKKILTEDKVSERVLILEDLGQATRVAIGNSVRGRTEVDVIHRNDGEVVWSSTFCNAE